MREADGGRSDVRGTVYEGSDGRYYTDVQLWERLESEAWVPFCWDPETGEEWVETPAGELLALTPVPESELPDDVELESHPRGLLVTDERDLSRSGEYERA